jgi:hypothetical protein
MVGTFVIAGSDNGLSPELTDIEDINLESCALEHTERRCHQVKFVQDSLTPIEDAFPQGMSDTQLRERAEEILAMNYRLEITHYGAKHADPSTCCTVECCGTEERQPRRAHRRCVTDDIYHCERCLAVDLASLLVPAILHSEVSAGLNNLALQWVFADRSYSDQWCPNNKKMYAKWRAELSEKIIRALIPDLCLDISEHSPKKRLSRK